MRGIQTDREGEEERERGEDERRYIAEAAERSVQLPDEPLIMQGEAAETTTPLLWP